MLHLDRSRDRDWTCPARGSSNNGNIIDRVVTSALGLNDAEICIADRSTDYVPMTDHRGIIAHSHIDPLDGVQVFQVKFCYHDLSQHLGKPRLQYPSSSAKGKYKEFQSKVDTAIKAEFLHLTPMNNDKSFITCYEALTHIFKQCGETTFGQVKCGGKSMHGKIMSSKIQCIRAKIKNLEGALRMTNCNYLNMVSHASQQCFNQYTVMFRSNTENCADLRSFLLLHRKRMYKSLYNKRMQEFYARAHAADKKQVTGILLGGSSKSLIASGEYHGLPTAVNSIGVDDELITEPNTIKRVMREYWSKLYKQQDTPDVPKPWLDTPSVIKVRSRVRQELFEWPIPASVADFRAMLRKGNH
jgi:hypothetical protein